MQIVLEPQTNHFSFLVRSKLAGAERRQSVASRVSSVSQVSIDWRNFWKIQTMEGGGPRPPPPRRIIAHEDRQSVSTTRPQH